MNPFEDITTPEQLLALFQSGSNETEVGSGNLKYAIYLRKSTDDPAKQVRSIEDQLSECLRVAKDNDIIVLQENIVEEHESAKEPNIRPKFRKLMDKMINGELDGLISWHPNRLTRNMREAGEIIDLLDKRIIKDLKFASHTFVNDSSGKMLLGMVFVMAKQYSDQLSADVKRGNEKSIQSGIYINKAKHGYKKDINSRLEPDGNNFALIKEAFRRRIDGESLTKIAVFLDSSNYSRQNSLSGNIIRTKFKKNVVERILKDPVYTGILKYGDQYVNLIESYGFIPAVSVPDFMKINNFDNFELAFNAKKARKNTRVVADLLNGKVHCSSCGKVTQASISTGKTKKYYYFKCTTPDCPRENKGTRAKVIMNFVYDFLAEKPFTSKDSYEKYKEEILKLQREGLADLNTQIAGIKTKIGAIRGNIEVVKSNLSLEQDSEIRLVQKEELKKIEGEELNSRTLLEGLQTKKNNVKKTPLTFKEFSDIVDSLEDKLRRVQSTTELNTILSYMFSNFTVSSKKVEKYRLKSPFDKLYETKVSNCGR